MKMMNAHHADRLRHAEYYANACAQRGVVPVWWDVGAHSGTSGLFDRNTMQWPFGDIADIIIRATQ